LADTDAARRRVTLRDVVSDQQALVADANTRIPASYGSATTQGRQARRVVSGDANRSALTVGAGAASTTVNGPAVDYFGRQVGHLAGIAGTTASIVPASTLSRFRLFASPVAAATLFWQGVHSAVLVTSLLSADQATQLFAYLNRRL
jgi:hypothetical protein